MADVSGLHLVTLALTPPSGLVAPTDHFLTEYMMGRNMKGKGSKGTSSLVQSFILSQSQPTDNFCCYSISTKKQRCPADVVPVFRSVELEERW